MPDEVILEVTTIEENVTVETTAGDVVEIQVVAPTGTAATVAVGTTTTGAAGTNASVTNSGTTSAAVFNFTIPRGDTGETGPAGPNSVTSATTSDGTGIITFASVGTPIVKATTSAGVSARTNGGTECFSWGAGNGQNFTFTAGTGIALNSTSYTFGAGASAALKTALAIASADISDATSDGDANKGKLLKTDGSGQLTVSTLVTQGSIQCKDYLYIYSGSNSVAISAENITTSREFYSPNASGTLALTDNVNGIPDKLTDGTIAGTTTFNSTSYTYGTGAAAAHRDALGVVEANPSTVYICDDFAGNTTASPTIGDLGWFSFASGGGTGALIAAPASAFPNLGTRTITCGNATNAGQVLYLNNWTSVFSYNWECCFVIAASQTTDCDIIAGFTKDTAAIGIGKFGGVSIGVRYSSATDTNWMYYSKNSNTTFAANDANNYSISSGVAASTTYKTFRIRCTAGVVEMSANGGAWTTVSTASVTLTGAWIPFFYVSARTTTSKSANIDFFSFKSTGLNR